MAEHSGFFDAQNLGTAEAPSWDRSYLAELFAKYFHLFIKSGVFSGSPTDPDQLLVQEQGGYNITLTPGYAFIRGYWYENDAAMAHAVDPTDGQYQRIDRLVIRWDRANRSAYSTIIKGTPSLSAVPPDILRGDDFFDLSLAQISISNQATQITQADITSEIFNNDVCGIVTGLVWQVDTTTIYNQIQSDLERYQNEYQAEWNAWSQMSRSEFDTWFATIQNILDENIAATLLSMILNQQFTAAASVDAEGRLVLTPNAGQAGDMYSMFFEVPQDGLRTKQVVVGNETLDILNSRNRNVSFAADAGVPSLFVRKGNGVYQIGGSGGSGGGGGELGITVLYQYTEPDPEDYEGFIIWIQAPEGIEIGEIEFTLSQDAPSIIVPERAWLPITRSSPIGIILSEGNGSDSTIRVGHPRYPDSLGVFTLPTTRYWINNQWNLWPVDVILENSIRYIPFIVAPSNWPAIGSFVWDGEGYVLTGTGSGAQGLAMISEEPIDLTGYKTLTIETTRNAYDVTGIVSTQYVQFGSVSSVANAVRSSFRMYNVGATQVSYDISALNGLYYPFATTMAHVNSGLRMIGVRVV